MKMMEEEEEEDGENEGSVGTFYTTWTYLRVEGQHTEGFSHWSSSMTGMSIPNLEVESPVRCMGLECRGTSKVGGYWQIKFQAETRVSKLLSLSSGGIDQGAREKQWGSFGVLPEHYQSCKYPSTPTVIPVVSSQVY
ncbi:hypothetical protein AO1008_07452 [Aspergillus oryzae 100-8]|uniref:Uncharacterized protein n=1 Tax=Aspergillus oryzae (strain 3.042) TaxID=1160506 RepID=I8A9F8_ASPO3|nr:hypothetical protein Ao3042_01946 [Aspergillus oryzae 3.042]KDE80525.1 hypothetical protein AO1008_07452 [Aspergillus oryzae 100-8]KOC14920.1 hypothetical protein AFLA70_820g000282 [Aspergillus flavus AF70]|eukprot:EIT81519.1 hypothetical protein Ao3042_01946 [Aspergillus oryzae 3.042]